jgi:hypothetical protein
MTSTRISVRCAADPALAGPRFSSDLLARLVAEPRSPVRVAVPMMKIRIARMRVDHRLMPVPMRMRLRDPPKMLVLVMLIMGMAAFVRLSSREGKSHRALNRHATIALRGFHAIERRSGSRDGSSPRRQTDLASSGACRALARALPRLLIRRRIWQADGLPLLQCRAEPR